MFPADSFLPRLISANFFYISTTCFLLVFTFVHRCSIIDRFPLCTQIFAILYSSVRPFVLRESVYTSNKICCLVFFFNVMFFKRALLLFTVFLGCLSCSAYFPHIFRLDRDKNIYRFTSYTPHPSTLCNTVFIVTRIFPDAIYVFQLSIVFMFFVIIPHIIILYCIIFHIFIYVPLFIIYL